eukprot:15442790-Alexandrium_andersonii.AAC.1
MAAATMVATAAALDTTAPEAVGKRGVEADACSEANTSSTCSRTVQAGQSAAASTGEAPGRRPHTHVRARLAPRPLGSVLETGKSRVTCAPLAVTSPM